jgi:hypothetical protein
MRRILFWFCWWYVVRTIRKESDRLADLASKLGEMAPIATLLFQLPWQDNKTVH